jgi:hypothetical protein
VFNVSFLSADSGAPGTLGVFLWSQTQTVEIDDQNVTGKRRVFNDQSNRKIKWSCDDLCFLSTVHLHILT